MGSDDNNLSTQYTLLIQSNEEDMFDDDAPSEINSFTKNNMLFGSLVKEYQAEGHSAKAARNAAIDYYRKFLSRESTTNWVMLADQAQQNNSHEQTIERIQFNDTVRVVYNHLDHEECRIFSLVLLKNDLFSYLDPDLLELTFGLAALESTDQIPILTRDIGVAMSYKLNKNKICCTLTKKLSHIKGVFIEKGFVP